MAVGTVRCLTAVRCTSTAVHGCAVSVCLCLPMRIGRISSQWSIQISFKSYTNFFQVYPKVSGMLLRATNHQHLPTVLATTHLNEFQYETLLLRSGIIFKHGQFNRVSYSKLDYLTTMLQQQYNMDFLATPPKFNNRNTVSTVIGRTIKVGSFKQT